MPGRFAKWLESDQLRFWFSTNVNVRHPKMIAIPIGCLNRRFSLHDGESLQQFKVEARNKAERAYLNFHVGDASEEANYRKRRSDIHARFAGASWVTTESGLKREEYLRRPADHRFVISPPWSWPGLLSALGIKVLRKHPGRGEVRCDGAI